MICIRRQYAGETIELEHFQSRHYCFEYLQTKNRAAIYHLTGGTVVVG
jgi:hypothetical protein